MRNTTINPQASGSPSDVNSIAEEPYRAAGDAVRYGGRTIESGDGVFGVLTLARQHAPYIPSRGSA